LGWEEITAVNSKIVETVKVKGQNEACLIKLSGPPLYGWVPYLNLPQILDIPGTNTLAYFSNISTRG